MLTKAKLTAYLNPPQPPSHHGHGHGHGHSNRRGSPTPEAPPTNPSPLPRYAEAYDRYVACIYVPCSPRISACGPPATNPRVLTATSYAIEKAMQRLHPFGLTRAELLMVLNLRPTSGARLDAIVEGRCAAVAVA